MSERSFSLRSDERVVYELPDVVVTSQRLLANFDRSEPGTFDEAPLADIAPPRTYNGGQRSRMTEGLQLLGGGAALLVIEVLLESSGGIGLKIAAVLFVAGSLAAVVGLYFVLASAIHVKPNTTVVFPRLEGKDIIVPFPEWDSPEAEELTRQVARAKRGI